MVSRIGTFCLVELQKLRHDRSELITRLIQPVLWLVIYGETFTRLRAIPTGGVPYLSFLAPGIMAQSALFVSIFYGIQIIWERDAGVLTKLMVTPTPRAALVTGKAFAAGIRALAQAVAILVVAVLLGVHFTPNPLRIVGALAIVVLGAAFFCCLSVTIAGLVLKRDRLMGIGQAIMMPLFFASNALYPVSSMPGWLQAVSRLNPRLPGAGGRGARRDRRGVCPAGPPHPVIRRVPQAHEHRPTTATPSRPPAIVGTAALAICYAAVLLGVAATVLYEQVTGTGSIGSEHLDNTAVRGVLLVGTLLTIGAVCLAAGARQLLVRGRRGLLAGPLAAVLAVGLIGETVDALGSATVGSDLIGAGILVLAALPLVLMVTPASRAWASAVRGA